MSSTLVLDATTKTISVVLAAAKTTTDPTYSVHYGDATSTAFVEGAGDGVLNGTTPVTVLASPAASTRRIVKELTIYNADTVAITANISLLNSSGSTSRIIFSVPIAVGATYKLSDGAASSGGTSLAKAAGSDVATGTDDAKYVTAKAIKDSVNVPNVAPGTAGNVMTSTGSAWASSAQTASGGDKYAMEARLTLETGVAVSTTDQTDKTSVYLTPYMGNQIATYSGTAWETLPLSADISLSLANYTADKNYDIWVYDNAGTLTLDSTVWTNDTTRATALALQDGVYCKTGALTRRYVGTIRVTATTGQCELSFGKTPTLGGSAPKCYVYNQYNKVPVVFMVMDSTANWVYQNSTLRVKNNSMNNAFRFVNGDKLVVEGNCINQCLDSSTTAYQYYGTIAIDSTTAGTGLKGNSGSPATSRMFTAVGSNICNASPGYHYMVELEGTSGTGNYFGAHDVFSQSGATYRTEM